MKSFTATDSLKIKAYERSALKGKKNASIKSTETGEAKKSSRRRAKPEVAAEEIREKVRLNQGKRISRAPTIKEFPLSPDKIEDQKNLPQLDEENTPPRADIGTNDPQDPVTQTKLKNLLQDGGFNFNPQERNALSQILKN
jgi:hypothetical protein